MVLDVHRTPLDLLSGTGNLRLCATRKVHVRQNPNLKIVKHLDWPTAAKRCVQSDTLRNPE